MSEYIEISGFEDKTPENITSQDAVDYLNAVLIIYGPPCEWCERYGYTCSKKFRPRQRYLKFGPFESWHLRKQCKKFKEKEEKDKSAEAIKKQIGNALDCSAQTYG